MNTRQSNKYGKAVKIIHPGEFYISSDDEIIGTLLGSCVAVCLFDPLRGMAGMNHFMLPGKISAEDIFQDRSARYGITAINELISSMERKGAVRKDLSAKIFGGGHVMESILESTTIPQENIRLAKLMMEIEDIPITETDTGSNFTRKVLLDVKSGAVYLKKSTRKTLMEQVGKKESVYAEKIGAVVVR